MGNGFQFAMATGFVRNWIVETSNISWWSSDLDMGFDLVGGDWNHGILYHFMTFHILGISSSQLTIRPSFFRGVQGSTTSDGFKHLIHGKWLVKPRFFPTGSHTRPAGSNVLRSVGVMGGSLGTHLVKHGKLIFLQSDLFGLVCWWFWYLFESQWFQMKRERLGRQMDEFVARPNEIAPKKIGFSLLMSTLQEL